MKEKANQVVFPATLIVVMVVFLAANFFANVNLSFAAEGSKKVSAIASRTSSVEHTEAQIKQLQGALNITAAQQELWNNLTQAMRENAKDMEAIREERAKDAKAMDAVEHMKFHRQITETHLAQLNKLIPPFEAFYDSMSDEQKKTTDTIFQTGKYGKHKRHNKK
jgi:hypothetical protein